MRLPERTYSGYAAFARRIRNEARYVLDADQRAFLDTVVKTSNSRSLMLPSQTLLWRARLGFNGYTPMKAGSLLLEMEVPHQLCDMKPLRDRSKEGRVNAKGMPCLYCSTDRDTAMNELRPWIGAKITVAELLTLRPLKIVDCTADHLVGLGALMHLVMGKKEDKLLWSDINAALSEPVTDSDDTADYVPTQALAEAFRIYGFDGIKYSGKVGEGASIALFDLEAATVISRHVFDAKSRTLTFEPASPPIYEAGHPSPQPQEWVPAD
ncbi:MAG: RES family NAD+ phosphorylase [Acidobacteriota bacterium]